MVALHPELEATVQQVVPVSSPLAISINRQLAELESFLKEEYRPGTPEGHFGIYLYELAEEAGPFPRWGQPISPDLLRQGQGPPLAATGFQLYSPSGKTSPETAEAWVSGLRRLSSKDAFPIDRQTFAFRPIELCGIALGASQLLEPAHELRSWLRSVFERLQRDAAAEPWTQALCAYAAKVLSVPWLGRASWQDRSRTIEVPSFVRWTSLTTHSLGGETSGSDLDREILLGALTSAWAPSDVARAAVVHHAIRRAVSERLESELSKTWLVGRHTADAVQLVSAVCRRFHCFARQIQHRHDSRPTVEFKDEYDVQDAMHAILSLHFADVRPEEWTPSYGGKSTRMDFLLKREQVVVEVKMTRKGLDQKGVLVQLTEDKDRYRVHPDCRALVCFVYDPTGVCDNPTALEADLSVTEGDFRVSVIVAPHGN